NGVIELLLANHPLDCPICDKGGECPLQDNAFNFGLGTSRFNEQKRHKEKAFPLGPRIVLDRERCIMCYRCVRFHQEIAGDEALAAVQRGPESEIATLPGETYDSMFAGNTIELCPVGALTNRQYRFQARPWDLVRTPSVCNGCAVGCNLEVHSRSERVLRVVSRENPAVDDGWLCDRGRFDSLPGPTETRLARPMLRADGRLREASWQEALERAADLLGHDGAVLASAGLSNEAFWVLERLAAKLPTRLWPPAGGTWAVEGTIQNLGRSKSIVLVGIDVWNELPVLALWIRRAVLARARLVVIGHGNGLWRDTTHWLRGAELPLVGALTDALGGNVSTAASEVIAAAAALRGLSPASLLVHPALVTSDRAPVLSLARALGASGDSGMVGAPLLGANARGAQEFAPSIVGAGEPPATSAAVTVLALGEEACAAAAGRSARLILASSHAPADDSQVEVMLPIAHAYERQATVTNLEGRVQRQEAGAAPPPGARPDWAVVAEVARRLGAVTPDRLELIRDGMIAERPSAAHALATEALVARV
ncbi:MAG: molybdopterin-dependent oxidoreductase, partial [Chloroflexota bacterium]|nr:molybdopterin-dependent oxidoreductase [Chloroflexota bacterium]